MARFAAVFLLVVFALLGAELTPPIQRLVVLPWTRMLTEGSAMLIAVFDPRVITSGNILQSTRNGFAVAIESGCNGVEAAIVMAAAMIAFPAPWRYRLAGIAAGLVAIQALNVLRVISLFYVGQWSPALFEWTHLYLWQALIMLDVLLVGLVWMRALPRTHA